MIPTKADEDAERKPVWSDPPANDAVRLDRIYRMLNEGLALAAFRAEAQREVENIISAALLLLGVRWNGPIPLYLLLPQIERCIHNESQLSILDAQLRKERGACERIVEGQRLMLDDLAALLRALGLGDHARPETPHFVMLSAIEIVRENKQRGDRMEALARRLARALALRRVGTFPMEQDAESVLTEARAAGLLEEPKP